MPPRPPHPGTIVTYWFVNTSTPAQAITHGRHAGRGFGRKYLAQLNPRWPITPIGAFPLNRSAPASEGEYYIAGYPKVSMVQTVHDDLYEISKVPDRILTSLPAKNVYIFATNPATGYGAAAHFATDDGIIAPVRLFAAKRNQVFEDFGLPEPFEAPLWAGEADTKPHNRLDLPFDPQDFVTAAHKEWLGFTVDSQGPTIMVEAFATDGRQETKVAPRRTPEEKMSHLIEASARKLQLNPADRDYDDYEQAPRDAPAASNHVIDAALKQGKKIGVKAVKVTGTAVSAVAKKVRSFKKRR